MFKILAKEPALLRRHIPVTFVYLSKWAAVQQFQLSDTMENYREAEPIPIPTNVDAAETTRFSHQRSRDISSTVITAQASISTIDITIDNSLNAVQEVFQDPHVQSYDCFGFISLNSAMQSNVPTPFGGFNKFSHLNMPGGQWSQENKFMAQNMHNSHYSALRDNARAEWATYDQNATVGSNCRDDFSTRRSYSTQSTSQSSATKSSAPSKSVSTETSGGEKFNKKEQLKRAFKEYGVSIVAFHVGISLISLGGFYVLVSSGINLVPVLEFLGIASPAIAEKVATGSSFVVAYAVHKVFAPARISITLGAIPFIIRYLRSKGFQFSKIKKN